MKTRHRTTTNCTPALRSELTERSSAPVQSVESRRDRSIKFRIVAVSLALCVTSTPSLADDVRWEVGLDLGRSTSDLRIGRTEFDVYRATLRKDFRSDFWSGDRWRFSGYWEASINFWDTDEENVYAAAISPVFALYFRTGKGRFEPYVELGIGAALISDHSFAGRELSTSFQFEDRIGVGIRGERFDFHYRYMHYSNGGIELPNNGFDANVLGATYRFR